jgi:hypothetical protein
MAEKKAHEPSALVSVADVSRIVTLSADLPISQLREGVSRILGLADSAIVTITGDASRIASAVVGLGERVKVKSARLTLSGQSPVGSSPR